MVRHKIQYGKVEQKCIQLEPEEFDAVIKFARFLKGRDFGEFTAKINTDMKRNKRMILIGMKDMVKINLSESFTSA